MASWLLALVGCIYLAIAVDYWLKDQKGMCLAFIAYALANLGFIIANVRKE